MTIKMHQNSKNEKKQSMAVVVASRIQVQKRLFGSFESHGIASKS